MSDRPLRILLVDDDEDQYVLVRDMLSDIKGREFDLEWAATYEAGLEAVAKGRHDVCLLDFRLGARTGLELLREVVASGHTTPVIMITGTGDHEVDIEAMKAGAVDYLEKDGITPSMLERAIRYAIERARTLDAVRRSEELYRRLVETANVVPWEMDAETHRFTYVGPQAAGLLGYEPADWYADGFCAEHIHPDDRELVDEFCQGVGSGGQDQEIEYRMLARDGRVVWVRNTVSAVSEGGRSLLRGFMFDITARKEAEEALRGTEEQLRQSQKMEAIGQLAGGVAHDFNNLLTVITGYSDFVLSNLDEGSVLHKDVQEVKKAADRAASLTSQLLAFSRKQMLEPKTIRINTLVSDMEKMLRRVIGEDIELTTTLAPELGFVRTDPGQFQQIIVNLAVNARDAMPNGGGLEIRTENADFDGPSPDGIAAGRYVMLSVGDTGVGMDEETRSRIFEPFFTTKEVGNGTGLGLSMVYGIVKQSRGHIRVDSEPGRGTAFGLYLPRLDEETAAPERKRKRVAPPRGSETILLVEDEDVLRRLGRRVLELGGYSVLEAREGREALHVGEEHEGPLNLVVTDVVMPRMGGRELAEQIAQTSPGTKVLYVSGYTDDVVVRNGVLEKGTAFLQKPYASSALLTKVREVLDTNGDGGVGS